MTKSKDEKKALRMRKAGHHPLACACAAVGGTLKSFGFKLPKAPNLELYKPGCGELYTTVICTAKVELRCGSSVSEFGAPGQQVFCPQCEDKIIQKDYQI